MLRPLPINLSVSQILGTNSSVSEQNDLWKEKKKKPAATNPHFLSSLASGVP